MTNSIKIEEKIQIISKYGSQILNDQKEIVKVIFNLNGICKLLKFKYEKSKNNNITNVFNENGEKLSYSNCKKFCNSIETGINIIYWVVETGAIKSSINFDETLRNLIVKCLINEIEKGQK